MFSARKANNQSESLANTKDGTTFAAKARAAELNAVRARKASARAPSPAEDEVPPLAPTSLGSLKFVKRRTNRAGRAGNLDEVPESSDENNTQISSAKQPSRILQRSHSSPQNQQEAVAGQVSTAQAPQTPGILSFSDLPKPAFPLAWSSEPPIQLSPAYPPQIYDHELKDWVPNPAQQWDGQMPPADMSARAHTPRSTRRQAQYSRQSSLLNPNVTPPVSQQPSYKLTASPYVQQGTPSRAGGSASSRGSPGNRYDPCGLSTINEANFASQATRGADFSSLSKKVDNDADVFNDISRATSASFRDPSPYGQTQYVQNSPSNNRDFFQNRSRGPSSNPQGTIPYNPQTSYAHHLVCNPDATYGQHSAYVPQSPSGQSFSEWTRLPQASMVVPERAVVPDSMLPSLRSLTMQEYQAMPIEEQKAIANAVHARSNKGSQASNVTPDLRDPSPYTGWDAASKGYAASSQVDELRKGLERVLVGESEMAAECAGVSRTVAHDPLAQQLAHRAPSTASTSTVKPQDPRPVYNSKQRLPASPAEIERANLRKESDPLPWNRAVDEYTIGKVNENLANQEIRKGWERGSCQSLEFDPPIMSAQPADHLPAGNMYLKNVTQAANKQPKHTLEDSQTWYRSSANDRTVKGCAEHLKERSNAILWDEANQPKTPGGKQKPNPIGHGRPGTSVASNASSSPGSKVATTFHVWKNPGPDEGITLMAGTMANLAEHANPAPNDPFIRYKNPPAHTCEPNSNKSLFDPKYQPPPARVARDSRYQGQMQTRDGRATYTEDPSAGRGRGSR